MPYFMVQFNQMNQTFHPTLAADPFTHSLRTISNTAFLRLSKCRDESLNCQFLDRNRIRACADSMDTRPLERLVGGERHHKIWDSRTEIGSSRAGTTVMDNCFTMRE